MQTPTAGTTLPSCSLRAAGRSPASNARWIPAIASGSTLPQPTVEPIAPWRRPISIISSSPASGSTAGAPTPPAAGGAVRAGPRAHQLHRLVAGERLGRRRADAHRPDLRRVGDRHLHVADVRRALVQRADALDAQLDPGPAVVDHQRQV